MKQVALVMIAALSLLSSSAGDPVQQSRSAVTEEFHQSYPIAAGGRVSLENINGSVKIEAWSRNEVKVDAVKRAYSQERLAEARIEVDASPDAIRIKTTYPRGDQTFTDDEERRYRNPASVEYTLTVPSSVRLESIELINGSLEINGINGDVRASSINGRLRASGLAGEAKLSTINGALEATFNRVDQPRSISLSSVNGSVLLTIPSDASAELRASTVHGGIVNDFGLPVRNGKYIGHELAGALGAGGAQIKLNNVNGRIAIRHASDNRPLSPASNRLPAARGNDEGDDVDVYREEELRVAREAREEARAQADVRREVERSLRESQRAQAQAVRESQRAQAQAMRESQRAQTEAQLETQRAIQDAQREAARAQAQVQRELERNRVQIERATREAARAMTVDGHARFSDHQTKTFAVSGVPRVNVNTFDGAIVVHGWDKSEVTYTAVRRASTEEALQAITLRAEQRGDEITIVAEYDKSAGRNSFFNQGNASVHLEVNVPRKTNLRASSGDGHLMLDGVGGELDVRTGDGGIDLRDGRGRLVANTGDGHIRVVNFDGSADVRTGDGGITLDGRFSELGARTGDGSISLTLPGDSNATIETNAESVTNDGLATAEEPGSKKRIQRWRVGQGGKIFTLRTGDGRIILRRAEGFR